MKKLLTRCLLVLAFVPPALVQDTAPPARLELERETDAQGQELLRGVFRVYEDREHETGRLLGLDVLVLLATGDDPRPDPIFVLAGGPGQAATRVAGGWADHWARAERDIVFVDQRGTAGDHALRCRASGGDDDLQGYLDPLFDEAAFRACRAELEAAGFDLTRYSTPVAMDDVDELRGLLGYETINLMGGSYGTRAALVFMRRHPERVRTAVLNGVAPLSFTNPLYHASEAQAGLERVLAECAADPDCSGAFPDLADEVAALFARLAEGPVEVAVRHPRTREPATVRLDREAFAEALRVQLYYTGGNRRVPLLLHRAHEGDFTPFAQRAIESNRGLRTQLAFGMLLCVTCAEDIARIDPETIPGLTEGTFLGDVRVRAQMAMCAFWPRSPLPEGFGEPVSVPVPTLVLSGTHDPVTGPGQGAEAARHLPRSLHVVVPGCHGVGGPCVDSIVRALLERGTVEGLETGCVESMAMPPFDLGH